MSSAYHITGILQACLFVLSISAVYLQLKFVRKRRQNFDKNNLTELATYNLSAFSIIGSFAAFYTFLLISTAIEPFAHYIFWSRIPACILGILLLWEFRIDYPSKKIALLAPAAATLFLLTLIFTLFAYEVSRSHIAVIQLLVVSSGVILISGQLHQLWLLLKNKRVGALSLNARTLNLMKDISTVAFGLALGVDQSWSVVAVASVNAVVTAVIIAVGTVFKNN